MLRRIGRWAGFLSATLASAFSFHESTGSKYISPDKSFEVNVPSGYGIHTGKDKPSQSYIPVCHVESMVCITVPRGRYKGTTFEDAAAEISVRAAKTEQACLNPGKYEVGTSPNAEFRIDPKNPGRWIGGVRFLHEVVGGAAMSHDLLANVYRGYKNGKCYELSVQVVFTNFAVYEPGAINEFTTKDQEHVSRLLMQILDSFQSP